jgi:hypothetical protein
MKKIYIVFLLLSCTISLQAQNCSVTSVGFTPLRDLGSGYWRGFQGGLYPGGSNYRPQSHQQAGLNIAQNLLPLDTAGNVDLINGKIVWLSIGMSNTTMETQYFIPMTDTFAQKNSKLVLVDGAQGGQDIVIIDNPNAGYWTVVHQRLAASGVTDKQVQVIWFKEAQAQPSDTAFATYPDSLKLKFKMALQIEHNYFPNTKLAYISDRIYAGYATSTLNPEPFAYYTGWTVKRLIEDQINGDTSLTYSGINPRVPWLSWAPDLWADGTTPRSDGLIWICPDDYNSDGTHPSAIGRQKVADMLFDFFSSDSTTVPWFIDQTFTGISVSESFTEMKVFPNPATSAFTISVPGKIFDFTITDPTGRIIRMGKQVRETMTFDSRQFSPGLYILKTEFENQLIVRKLLMQN